LPTISALRASTPRRFSSVLMILLKSRTSASALHLGRVLEHDQLGVVVEADAEFLAGGAAIGGFDPALRP
jgi:hypothetical protein